MRKYLWIIVICVVAAGAWFYFQSGKGDDSATASGGGHKSGSKGATVPVGVATAKTGSLSVYMDGLGNVTPRQTVTVHTLINGQLMKIFFTEGQMVKKDGMLAKIDDRPYVALLEQAKGLLTRDQALLAEAKLDLVRYQVLWKQDSIAKQQLDTQASLVKQYEGAVINDQGQIDTQKVNIIYTNITSPVTGRVGLRQVDEGNIVHTTDTNGLVIVTELQPITAIFTIPEDDIPTVLKHINAGDRLSAEAWDRDNKNKLAAGTLTAIDNEVDPSTGTVKFRAEFANEDNTLFPSQFVNIRLKLDTLDNVVLIPVSAVQRGVQGTFVYKVTDKPPAADKSDKKDKGADDKDAQDKSAGGKADGDKKPAKYVSVQPVTLGPAEGESVSVEKGVSSGDSLVVDGADSLRDGAKIDIASSDGKPAGDKGDKKGKKDDQKDGAQSKDDAGSDKPRHHHKKHSDDGEKAQ